MILNLTLTPKDTNYCILDKNKPKFKTQPDFREKIPGTENLKRHF